MYKADKDGNNGQYFCDTPKCKSTAHTRCKKCGKDICKTHGKAVRDEKKKLWLGYLCINCQE